MLTPQSGVKEATGAGILCECANSHRTRNFTGDADQQAEFRNVLLCPKGVWVEELPQSAMKS